MKKLSEMTNAELAECVHNIGLGNPEQVGLNIIMAVGKEAAKRLRAIDVPVPNNGVTAMISWAQKMIDHTTGFSSKHDIEEATVVEWLSKKIREDVEDGVYFEQDMAKAAIDLILKAPERPDGKVNEGREEQEILRGMADIKARDLSDYGRKPPEPEFTPGWKGYTGSNRAAEILKVTDDRLIGCYKNDVGGWTPCEWSVDGEMIKGLSRNRLISNTPDPETFVIPINIAKDTTVMHGHTTMANARNLNLIISGDDIQVEWVGGWIEI